ncbi:hypothetical protein H3T12_00720 [Streptomyces sp. GMR22]|nr:hypothetical protein [Streptomyces sp. GMR22]
MWAPGDEQTRQAIEGAHERAIAVVIAWIEDDVAVIRYNAAVSCHARSDLADGRAAARPRLATCGLWPRSRAARSAQGSPTGETRPDTPGVTSRSCRDSGWEQVRPQRDHRRLCGLLKIVPWPRALA